MSNSNSKSTKTIRSISGYLRWVDGLGGSRRVYRGLASSGWRANSSVERRIFRNHNEESTTVVSKADEVLKYTQRLLAGARRRGFHINENQLLSELMLLAKLQHDGAATCFIDFTREPLVALWFACAVTDSKKNGRIISVDADDDTKFAGVPDGELEKPIKHFFERRDKPWTWQPPVSQNTRALRQKSVFVFGRADIVKPDRAEIIIAESVKAEIREALRKKHGIDEDTLFPDYQGFVRLNASDRDYQFSAEDYRLLAESAQRRGDHLEAIKNYTKIIELGEET